MSTDTDKDTDLERDDEGPKRPLVPRGNPLRAAGAIIALVAFVLLVLLMAKTAVWRFGVPIGAGLTVIAACGILDALGTFDDRDVGRIAKVLRLGDLAPPLACLALSLVVGFATVTFAVAGRTSIALNAVFITGAALSSLYFLGKLLERAGVLRGDDDGTPRPLWRRHGAWLLAIAIAIDLPMLGSHGLVDPWETHYGEVAREIIARDDWISLWWAQDGWFWSKPVLDFWLQALSMATFGVRTGAGAMLSAAGPETLPWPEWAVRLPIAAMALVAVYVFYKAIAGSHGRRAGFFAGLVLATMPQWFLVTHQTMTDMPFVASMVAALALFVIGLRQEADREVRLFELRLPGAITVRLGAHHLVLGAITVTVLPQIAMLVAQNVWFGDRFPPWRIIVDAFSSGSPGNCSFPGNEKCTPFSPTWPRFQPALQAVLWVQALAFVLALSWGERRARRLAFLAAWWFVALATLAKGAPGLAIPIVCIGLFAVLDGRVRELLEMEAAAGFATLIAVVAPWFVAMVMRHGTPFVDRLLFHDMVERALGHVHDTNQGDDVSFGYYLWQLGYATFPWVGMVPIAIFRWTRRGTPDPAADGGCDPARRIRHSTTMLLGLWFFVAFALFSLVETKFHHYILPAVPALAGLLGIACDRAWRMGALPRRPNAASLSAARWATASFLGAPWVLFVARDLVMDRPGGAGQARLMHLFSYNYTRGWPDSVDLRASIAVFAVAAAIATALTSGPRLARVGITLLSSIAVLFAMWGLDVYLVKASPHWGQRELVLRYLAEQQADPGPIVAYQLNWKGENFYTGNHVAAFASSGRPFREWVQSERRQGRKTFYVITSPDRANTLAAEMSLPGKTLPDGTRQHEGLEVLTTPAENNKFVLVRVRLPRSSLALPIDG